MPPLVVFVNPHSRANRRDPGLADRFSRLLRETGHVLAPRSFEELADQARQVIAQRPRVVAIHGGDGTLHRALGALIRAHGEAGPADGPLPPIAILAGGTMNVVSHSLGIYQDSEQLIAQLAEDVRNGRPVGTISRHCLQIGDAFGFVFGNGLMANFLEEYYAKGGYGPGRALTILAKTFSSALLKGPFAARMFRRFQGRAWVDDQLLPWQSLTGIGAATVREVGLRFKLNHRADEHPDRFSVLAIHGHALGLALDMPAVYRGTGVARRRAYSATATRLVMEADPSDGEMLYTIDGDLYRTRGRLEVSLGPNLAIVRPRGTPGPAEPAVTV